MSSATETPAILRQVKSARPTLWTNSDLQAFQHPHNSYSADDVVRANQNWHRFAPLLAELFPELAASKGVIESELLPIPAAQRALGGAGAASGQFLLKADGDLPVAGSIKARGGIYEVLMFAEQLAQKESIPGAETDPLALISPSAKALFARHTIAVGSTGNLGLSVGIAGAALGFQTAVHMSADAKAWKVARLQDRGVRVVQHQADYGEAVERARAESEADPAIYFVDDESSELLFFGYSAAALRLKEQLAALDIPVDVEHPLFLYLPCGIGGAPSGISFGAKSLWREHVHCFFVEPVQAPCALLQFAMGGAEPVSVYDFGLTNDTEADGMAVARFSNFLAGVMRPLVSGVLTVSDEDLFRWLALLQRTELVKVEPSAASVCGGPSMLMETAQGQAYLKAQGLEPHMASATHILWTTGGSFVPEEHYQQFLARGDALL